MKKKLIKCALRIVELEKEFFNGGSTAKYLAEFDAITKKLSAKDMIEIDNYIVENNLLDRAKAFH